MKLHPFQSDLIEEVRAHFRAGKRRVLIQSPTGSGKTVLTAFMIQGSVGKQISSWFTVHRRELIKQSARTFSEMGIDHGIISAGFKPHSYPLAQVASIQSLARRWKKLKRPRLIVIDEAHHVAATTWAEMFTRFPEAYFIGLTATPERLDGKGLSDYFEVMVKGPSIRWLIENKYLAPFRLYAPPVVPVEQIRTRMGDFVRSELSAVMNTASITGDVVAHYLKHAAGKRAIVRGVNVAHSINIAARFRDAGIRAVHVDGETLKGERDDAMARFEAGEIEVLSNCDLFSEGVDVPAVECVIDLRPTQSLTLWLQFCGRVMRYIPGKTATILDHAGNCMRHGLPDQEREWSLDGRKAREASEEIKIEVKVCPRCLAAQEAGSDHCIFCGYLFEKKPRKEIKEQDGELVEMTEEMMARRRARKEQHRAVTLQELTDLGVERGYKYPVGWARHVMRSRHSRGVA